MKTCPYLQTATVDKGNITIENHDMHEKGKIQGFYIINLQPGSMESCKKFIYW